MTVCKRSIMFQQEDKNKQERYILATQVISFLLLAMVTLTAISFKEELFNAISYRSSTIMFLVILPLIVAIRFFSSKYQSVNFEHILNAFFLSVSAILLVFSDDSTYKILLIMPIILSASRSGVRYAFTTCFLSLLVYFM